jgi:ABC-2 type transport system permease protein
MPAIVIPQLLLCGLLVPRDDMAGALQAVADVLPLTYAYDGLARVTTGGFDSAALRDLLVVVGAALLALTLGATTLRRRTP